MPQKTPPLPRAPKGHANRRSAENLLDAGLDMLAEISIERLTIDVLCKRLGVTKGSFYHHFKGRGDYLNRLLEHWALQAADKRMEAVKEIPDAKQRFLALVSEGEALPKGPEISIRAWAQRDPMARKHVQRLDAMRMTFLRDLFEQLTGDAQRAAQLAHIGYSLYIGTRMIVPPITGGDHARLLHTVATELYGLDLPEPK